MENINIPQLENWWLGDSSYHLNPPIESRPIVTKNAPDSLDQNNPFQIIDKPEPLYVSKDLSAHLKAIVSDPTLFENLFTEVENINTEIIKQPVNSHYDPNLEHSAAETDESFNLNIETENPELCDEIETHLAYLKSRLSRLNTFSKDSIKQQNELNKKKVKREFVFHHQPKATNYSTIQMVDFVGNLNERCIQAIEAREFISLYELEQKKIPCDKIHERQCGGLHTQCIKRNLAPPRKNGKLKEKSIPRSVINKIVGDGVEMQIVSYQKPNFAQDFNYNKNAHPQDSIIRNVNQVQLGHFDDRIPIIKKKQIKRPETVQFVTYKSIDDERKDITELKLNSKDENDVLEATAQMLAQLKTDERHLVTLMTDYKDEFQREPAEGWYERKDGGFGAEMKQANIRAEMFRLADQMGVDIRDLGNIQSVDAGC
ncbi:hypothetical protein SS50377_22092 [Spironucleus salmonicida]|uniref:Uncharacterized protein n=1 Tax=Spironucleus salmonicida TaxID=348837 RepID=V6LPV8_9EUKA|nr:hypothetical protein SS50377_22092 [Spironucleus salmonicida]|eukprot:EST45746.1 hypothetical protein SS50377_14317 [Spironucleus salmonicida]